MNSMKSISFVALFALAVLFAGCSTSSQENNLEAKRRAAIEKHREQAPTDEAQTNLLNAQKNRLDRDTDPLRAY
jgi:predicted component of type VI protein secretion system